MYLYLLLKNNYEDIKQTTKCDPFLQPHVVALLIIVHVFMYYKNFLLAPLCKATCAYYVCM